MLTNSPASYWLPPSTQPLGLGKIAGRAPSARVRQTPLLRGVKTSSCPLIDVTHLLLQMLMFFDIPIWRRGKLAGAA